MTRRPSPPRKPPNRRSSPSRRNTPRQQGSTLPWTMIVGGVVILLACGIAAALVGLPRWRQSRPTPTQIASGGSTSTPSRSVATSTPMVTSLPHPDTLFVDDFNQGLKPDWEIGYGEWRMVNKRLKVISFVGGEAQIFVGDPGWENYAVDLDAGTFAHDWLVGNDNSVVVYVRLQDRSNSMWFQIASYLAACGIKKDGEDTTIHLLEEEIGTGDRHLRIEARDNKYEFLINGQRICFLEDDTYSRGSVGLWARQGEEDNEVWIDNFRVTYLP